MKNGDISDKKRFQDAPQLWERTNCGKIRKSEKQWKILRLIYIVSIFFIIIKNCKKSARTFAPT